MISRMLWNASRDPLVEIGEFLPLYYGKAAPYIKLYRHSIYMCFSETTKRTGIYHMVLISF